MPPEMAFLRFCRQLQRGILAFCQSVHPQERLCSTTYRLTERAPSQQKLPARGHGCCDDTSEGERLVSSGEPVVPALLGQYPPAATSDAVILVFMTRERVPGARRGPSSPPLDVFRHREARRRAVRCTRHVSNRRSDVYSIVHRCVRSAAMLVGSDGKTGAGGVLRGRPRHKRRCESVDIRIEWVEVVLGAAAQVGRLRSAGRVR